MVLKQNFVARFFKRTNIQLRIASAGSGVENGQLPTGPKTTFLVPALHKIELAELVPQFFPGCEFEDVQFFMTSHSCDTVKSLFETAKEFDFMDDVNICRVESVNSKSRIEYFNEDDLKYFSDNKIELR